MNKKLLFLGIITCGLLLSGCSKTLVTTLVPTSITPTIDILLPTINPTVFPTGFSHATPIPRPNIIVIETDDQDDMGTLDIMLNVQTRLINQGVRFVNSFAENPLCCPSRTTFLTGQVCHNTNVWSNGGGVRPGGVGAFTTDNNTLPVWLKNSGYYTGLIGKYLNGYGMEGGTSPTYIPPGWDNWQGLVDPSTYQYYGYTINENGILHSYGNTEADYQTNVLSGKAIDFINSRATSSRPFFLWLTPLAPHVGTPGINAPEPASQYKGAFSYLALPQPPSFNEGNISDKPQFIRDNTPLMDDSLVALTLDSYQKRRETLLSVDDMVGKIIDTLTQTNELNNTYIIYTSDNGYFNGEHRFPVAKYLAYEESIRVPLIIRGPGIPIGETRNQLVYNADLTSTILELTHSTSGRIQDGQSIVQFINNSNLFGRTAMLFEGMDHIYWQSENYGYYSAIRTKDFMYIEHTAPDGSNTIIDREFYDLRVDPYELQSQHNNPDYADMINYLSQVLLPRLQTCSGPTCEIDSPIPTLSTFGIVIPADIGSILMMGSGIDLSRPFDIDESNLTPEQRKEYK